MFDFISEAIDSVTSFFDSSAGKVVGTAVSAGAAMLGDDSSGGLMGQQYRSRSGPSNTYVEQANTAEKADEANADYIVNSWVRLFADTTKESQLNV